MSGLLYLTAEDFSVAKTKKGNLLCTNIRGYSVLLIYSTMCVHCKELVPIFKRLPTVVGNCQFAMVNISVNKSIAKMSNDTLMPIKYVPIILFCVEGKPFMKYTGPSDINEIGRFIMEITQKLGAKKFYEETVDKRETANKIPEYTIGIPKSGTKKWVGDMLCDGDVCYMNFDEKKGYVKS